MDGVKSCLIPTIEWFVTIFFTCATCQPHALHVTQITSKLANILWIDSMPHYCCAGECYNSSDYSHQLKAIRDNPWWLVGGGEMSVGGEVTMNRDLTGYHPKHI